MDLQSIVNHSIFIMTHLASAYWVINMIGFFPYKFFNIFIAETIFSEAIFSEAILAREDRLSSAVIKSLLRDNIQINKTVFGEGTTRLNLLTKILNVNSFPHNRLDRYLKYK